MRGDVVRGLANHEPVPVALGALTVLGGLIDAVSFLALGRVFTANMTGNLVFLGFAAAGKPGFDVAAGGDRARRVRGRRRGHRVAGVLDRRAAPGVPRRARGGGRPDRGRDGRGVRRYLAAAALALAMGVRDGTVNRLAVPGMTTTVLTRTLAALAG
ncbi:DUF1275 family protein [Amycolatopsis thermoflava]|uniref:DUF1275 family protein n=1 Tax=Amycolatopsis thermoflava TaxID=84480 RepID=UPI003656961B